MEITQEFLEEVKTASQVRAAFYSYFYNVFREPVQNDFLGLTEQFLPHFERLAEFTGTEEINNAVKDMKKYLEGEKQLTNEQEYLDELNRQFTSTYLLGRNSVPTSASVYISPDKLLKREPWEKVCEIYRRRGFKMPENFNEPEDHIAMEMLYLKKLSDLVISLIDQDMTDKIEEILKEHKEFIDNHVLTWAKDFTTLTVKQSTTSNSLLYGATATIMLEFLQYDTELSDELLNDTPAN